RLPAVRREGKGIGGPVRRRPGQQARTCPAEVIRSGTAPATSAEPPGMKITTVRTFPVYPGSAKNWLFVKIETDAGIHGWGECYTQADRDLAIETHVEQLGRYLIGRSPHDIKYFTFMAYTDFASKRGSMDLFSAISGLEQAL